MWSRSQGEPPPARYNHKMISVNSSLFLFGGYGAVGPNYFLNDLYRFDTTSLLWTMPACSGIPPSPRNNFAADVLGDWMFVFGGKGPTTSFSTPKATYGDMYAADPLSGVWTILVSKGTAPTARFVPVRASALADTRNGRYGHGMAYHGGLIYLFGGQTSSKYFNDLYAYNLTSLIWKQVMQKNTPPSTRSYFGFVESSSGLALFGGYFRNTDNVFMGDFYLFDPDNASWANMSGPVSGVPPSVRINHGFASIKGKDGVAYSFGGILPSGTTTQAVYFNDLFSINLATSEWNMINTTGWSPSPRASMGFAEAAGQLFVFGGKGTGTLLDDLYSIHPEDGIWQQYLASANYSYGIPPPARAGLGFASIADFLYVFGGEGFDGVLNDLHRFIPENSSWTQLHSASTPSPRSNFGFVAAGDILYLFGGSDSAGNLLNDLHTYDPATNTWELRPGQPPVPRTSFGFAFLKGFLYVFGGRTISGPCSIPSEFSIIYNSDLHEYNPEEMKWTEVTSALSVPSPAGRCGMGFTASAGRLLAFGGCTTSLQNDLWAVYPPTSLSWPTVAGADFFINVYDWDTLELPSGYVSELSLSIELCSAFFPCHISIQGSKQSYLSRTSSGSIHCQVRLGCSGIQIVDVRVLCDGNTAAGSVFGIDGQTSLNVSNSSFTDCVSASDGSIFGVSGGVSVHIADSSFDHSIAFGSGGALALSESELYLIRSTFRNCTADAVGYGGAISMTNSHSVIEKSNFYHCTSSQGGGALVISGGVAVVSQVVISGCLSHGDGGGIMIFQGAILNLSQSELIDLFSGGHGGAIIIVGGQLHMFMTNFSSCRALNGGGALFASQSQCYGAVALQNTELFLEACNFRRCGSEGNGGAVLITSNRVSAFIVDALFSECISKLAGGASFTGNGATLSVSRSAFLNNTSYDMGGAMAAVGSAHVFLSTIIFKRCIAKISGGSVSIDSSFFTVESTSFLDNVADGTGGGAIYSKHSNLLFRNSTFARNSAPKGGGGALFWEGSEEPLFEPEGPSCVENLAAFGPCLASSFKYLYVLGMPSASSPAYPGLEFSVLVMKKDAYNQTIITDSGTVLLTQAAREGNKAVIDPFLYISGKSIVKLQRGMAMLSLILKPTYSDVDWNSLNNTGIAVLASKPFIFFYGSDVETSLSIESFAIPVALDSTNRVCPPGYVLALDASVSSNLSAGTCIECVQGKYSVEPLAGTSPNKPACFNCPAGGICEGGNKVTFDLGLWEIAGGMYKLISCPPGFQLINLIGGKFSHDIQQCLECRKDQYILNSNYSAYTCQDCPSGARCDGSSLYGRVPGSTWLADTARGEYILTSCPPGYELLAAVQECGHCPAGYYCVGGSAQSTPCPDNYFAPDGANSSASCEMVVFVNALISMPLTRDKFLLISTTFKEAIAAAARLPSSNILIQSVNRRAGNVSSENVLVTVQLAASDIIQAESCRENLNSADLARQFTAHGLPIGDLRSVVIATSPTASSHSEFPISATIGICIGAFAGFTICSFGAYFLTNKIRKQAEHRAFLSAFINAKAGMPATQQHLPYKLRETYVAEYVLGKGAFGCVLQARLKTKQGTKQLAIKIIVPERGGFNEREMRQHTREALVLDLMTQSKSEHAVHLAGHGSVQMRQDICWFVMELLQGQNLENVIKDPDQGPMKDSECIKAARNVLAALKLMHSEGLIHRDIKPSNIMRSRLRRAGVHHEFEGDGSDNYKLIDFGTAIGVDERVAEEAMMTMSKEPVGAGTPPYMSPEMFKCPDEAKFPTDLWSLGVTLFELAAGLLPFQAESSFMWSIVIAGDLDETAPSVLDRLNEERRSRFDHNLAKVIAKALEKRVQNRYSSVDEMHEAIYSCLIRRGEAVYSVFISYRVSSEAPLARILFDVLNHTVTPGGHRVTVYWDAFRLIKGEGWEEGFATGLLNSICMFPLLSHGSTAPLAHLPDGRESEGWESMPAGRIRLQGLDSDPEDNFLKELLIGGFLLERKNAHDRRDSECGMLEVIYPILIGRQEPKGHPHYPKMGDFFQVQGGGGKYPTVPSPATNRAAAGFLREKCCAPSVAVQSIEKRSVAQAVQIITSLQGCQLWNHPKEVEETDLSKEQNDLVGKGSVGPAVNIGGILLTAEQQALCSSGFDERQLRMLKAEVIGKLPDFHEVIDRAIAARQGLEVIAESKSLVRSETGRRNSASRRGSAGSKVGGMDCPILSSSLEFCNGFTSNDIASNLPKIQNCGQMGAC